MYHAIACLGSVKRDHCTRAEQECCIMTDTPVKLWLSIKLIATEIFSTPFIVGWLFNNILKIRQNRFSEA